MGTSPEAIARICIDIMIVAIIGLSAVFGWRKGLASVIFSCFRWLICIVVSAIGSYPLKSYIVRNTQFDDAIQEHVKNILLVPGTGNEYFISAPEQIQNAFSGYQQNIASSMALSITDRLMNILSFLLIAVVLIILTRLILLALESRKKRGPIGIFNGILGFLFGVLRGVFIISVVMLALFPILSFTDPQAASPIIDGVRQSTLASLFYDHNPISLLFEMF